MIGIVVGAAVAVGLFSMARRARRRMYGYAMHGGCGGHGGGHGYGRRRRLMRWLFEKLDTTPGQEKVIMGALEELRENRAALREELDQTRGDIARVVRGGLVDDTALEEAFARHDRLLARLRVSFVEAARKATESLDERQRKALGDLLEGRRFASVWA
jgi:Spy/CpxP family protein refolding chaperone